ncbi:MAG: penicillin-binding protein 2 [Actinobacteria bacterium]|nr:penicillin-binding protein 2 [Actinomycetota bacterium]NBY43703.1 penicillin-binding protein 2 [Micrococcales bacterium]
MTPEIKRIANLIILMFLSLFVAASTMQVFSADDLNNDSRNQRAVYDGYKTQRGSILVNNQPIAESIKTNDPYQYIRKYYSEKYSSLTGYYSLYQGRNGLENFLDSSLRGDNSAQFFEQLNALFSGNPVTGASVELTIDEKIQQIAWDALGNKKGAVIVMEPSTGKILALVSKPGFDANLLSTHDISAAGTNYQKLITDKGAPLINRVVDGLYAPGSVFKLVVAAAAFESGKYTPESLLPNQRKYTLPGTSTVITNSGESSCGGASTVSIATALKLSCNIPFAQLGVALGQAAIAKQAEAFGFGASFNIPLKSTPSVYPNGLDDAQTAMTAFGQFDVRVTPLQMMMVTSAIANGGIEMKPYLVDQIFTSNLTLLEQGKPSEIGRAISTSTAESLKSMMVKAVSSGVSSNAQIPGVKVAGKTGTAQNGEGQPYTLWFTGFAPADNPQVAVTVVIEDGGGMGQSGRGNTLAAPIAKKIMQAVLNK